MKFREGLGAQKGARAVGGLAAKDEWDRRGACWSAAVELEMAALALPADDVDCGVSASAHAQMGKAAKVSVGREGFGKW
jgi:hypothetical protein